MSQLTQDRLVPKEVSLGQIREQARNEALIGLSIAPLLDVQSDDVVFDYLAPDTSGLAPARAEDAESEMAEKDDFVGSGRASLIDWAIKDHYSASDVTRYREFAHLIESGPENSAFVGRMNEDFALKLNRDTARRRRKLDNRVEWLIMSALGTGQIVYDDGKIKFTVDYGRPAGQEAQTPADRLVGAANWDVTDGSHDPLGDLLRVDDFMWDTYGIRMGSVIMSRKAISRMLQSEKFYARSGLAAPSPFTPTDTSYVIDGWSVETAKTLVENATGIRIVEYEGIYRTRPFGSQTVTTNRFLAEDVAVFLPAQQYVNEIDDTSIGFAKTLTSPHPEGNWQSGFYEWERDTVDPWGYDRGTGIKAFPVFPHMEYTYTMDLWT